jgi:hypothetical protein
MKLTKGIFKVYNLYNTIQYNNYLNILIIKKINF